jgi:hypothetical protein
MRCINESYVVIFRGGSISWSIRQSDYVIGSSTVPVRLHQRHSWRRSAAPGFWGTPECDASTIANGTALLGRDTLRCLSTDCYSLTDAATQSISTEVLCTDFSVDYDYASGENSTMLELPINKQYVYKFESCCWIQLLRVGTPAWSVSLVIDTHPRIDGK